MPNWDDLRYFLAIAREGSLASAARTLRVDATTVGRRLAALEEELGTRLFDRMPAGFVPTAAGRNIRASVEEMESTALAVERKASGEDARLEGTVRITTTEAFAVRTLLPLFGPFRERHPGIEVQFLTDYGALDLARREADIAVRLTRPQEDTLVARKVGEIAIAPYAAERYLARRGLPDPATGFAGHELIGYADAAAKWPEARWMNEVATSARVAVRCNSLLSVVAAAGAGVGLGLMPCFMGDREPGLRRLMPPVASLRRDIWLVVHRDLQHNARVRAVLHFLAELIQRERSLIAGEGPPAPRVEPAPVAPAVATPRKAKGRAS
ncbi:LysR family transcriptional regulator [Hyalangium rubrum]|uniref:LysR family transcriptional regulator n=1 Tax=Hyalangium rubrum TaxID=3103134 RepID=A0ABU5HFH9_9BACT|nr:LysR family transcriptional regulator [Hyalangium sp. s54d21]MDY7232236.1 LysR family transcriptional regulator [Hyalangium sp. s54d21]